MSVLNNTMYRRAETLRQLHRDPGVLQLVNVWDVASARVVAETPGCAAIATASAAIAASHGYEDGENIPLDLHLGALRRICSAVDLPVTADLERGYGDVRATVESAIEAGVVGVNLEDDLCPITEMQARIRDACTAGRMRGVPIVLNARTDVFLNHHDRDEDVWLAKALTRCEAYLDAGADCVFVPGCVQPQTILSLATTLGPGRLSLLALPGMPDAQALRALGVARLSHGPFPHRHALAALAAYGQPSTANLLIRPSRVGAPPAPQVRS